jgi:hypothetical protein
MTAKDTMDNRLVSSALANGRYLLYLDLLGFSNLVETREPEDIYAVIDSALQSFYRWEELNQQFKTIYFSDTFLFYQEHKGYGDWAFLDVYAIGAMLLSALLAQQIPARGAITFGEIEIREDSKRKHQIYYGKALIEAYRAEKKEQWIGIVIQPSAWIPYETSNKGLIEIFEQEKVWKRRDDAVLLLNPFIKLRAWYEDDLIGEIDRPYMEWDKPAFPNDLLGFRFLHAQANNYARRDDFSGREAIKYHNTIAFLRDVLGKDMYEWAMKISMLESDAQNDQLNN